MLIRISLILAIVAAIAAGTLNILQVRDKITTLISQRDDYHTQLTQTQDTLDKTTRELTRTKNNLAQTQQQLADANTARKAAEDTAAAQTKRADDLSDKLTQTTQERDDAQNQLAAYTATGVSAEQVGKLNSQLRDALGAVEAVNEEKVVLNRTIDRLKTELAKYEGTNADILLPASLTGKILVVDPKWDFVVLNVGDDQGVVQDGQLLVSRDGKLVAKVIVRSVEKDRCIANIMPGWKLGEVIEGDEVSPAHPAPSS
jgi:flagellar biosynthesis chaperone FliJ